MNDNIVPFKPGLKLEVSETRNGGSMAGHAHCLQCRTKWTAVASIGDVFLECPSCGCHKGVFTNTAIRGAEPHWTCKCGNDLFFVTPTGCYCANCTTMAHFK